MINTKLDSKFESFLTDTKQKILELGKELEFLGTENSYLEQQCSDTFHNNGDLQIQVKNLEDQLNRFNSIHSLLLKEHSILNEKVNKAKNDYERLSIGYNQQAEIIKKENDTLSEREKITRVNRKTREEMFIREMEHYELKLLELRKKNNSLKKQIMHY